MEKYRMLCSVPECKDKESRRHRFPEDPVLFKIWLERIGNSKLLNKDKKAVRRTNLVCERHFSEKCLITSKLKKNSLPTLHIPGLSKNLAENSFYIPPDPPIVHLHSEHAYCKKMDLKETLILPAPLPHIDLQLSVLPSTSKSVERSGNMCADLQLSVATPSTGLFAEKIGNLCTDLQLSVATPSTSKGLSTERIGNLCTGSTLKRKRAMLNEIDVRRQLNLIPRAKHFYSVAALLHRKAYLVKRKCLSFKSGLRIAEKFAETQLHFIDKLNDSTYNSIMSQRDEKILAQSFYKRSPKCYGLSQKVFAPPSSKTLSLELQKVPLTTGFNEKIFEHITETVKNMKRLDKYCSLAFAEMSIRADLQYNLNGDIIEGFEDSGFNERKKSFADHAIVFMLRGLRRNWKQPIWYAFSAHSTSATTLIRMLRKVIREVRKTGLKLIATVCDETKPNVSAIRRLLEETNAHCLRNSLDKDTYTGYLIDGEEVIHIYDPPHLLMGIRNNLILTNKSNSLTKKLTFVQNGIQMEAYWQHIIKLYEFNREELDISLFPHLKDEHIYPDKLDKNNVSYGAQVFSQHVAARMHLTSKYKVLPIEASQTAQLLLFVDKLFDSVNSNIISFDKSHLKPLRCVVTSTSQHVTFWNEAKKVIETMRFVDVLTGSSSNPPTLTNWLVTLRGMERVWNILKNAGFKYFLTRNLNQDHVENFFSQVRELSQNPTPSCSAFSASFKTLLLNNLISSRAARTN